MSHTRFGLSAIILLFLFQSVFAQVQHGLRVDNYSGISSIRFNPAGSTTFPLKWDINLFEGAVHGANNYGYVQKSNLFHALNNIDNLELYVESETPSDEAVIIDYYRKNRPFYGIAYAHLTGPSVLIAKNPYFHWGITTSFRSMVSSQMVDPEMGYVNFEDVAYYEPFTIKPAWTAAMVWSEIGLHANYIIPTSMGKIGIGGHIKWLQGWEAGFVDNLTEFTSIRTLGDSLFYDRLDATVSFTTSNLNIDETAPQAKRNGGGAAVDLGIVYTIEDSGDKYRWRLGAALVDIGRIRFDKHAEQHRFAIETPGFIVTSDYDVNQPADSLIRQLSQDVLGASDASRIGSSFAVWLPAALNLQADYSAGNGFYLNALISQGIPLGKPQIRRGSLLALGPRYERRWWAVNMPLSLYNWQDFRFGFSARLAFITIGTDDLESLIGQREFDSTDFYISLKVNPFSLNLGRGKDGIKCYEF